MKKILSIIALLAAFSASANAFYISGGANTVSGKDDYHGTNVNLLLGMDDFAMEPSWKNYSNKYTNDFNTYAIRFAKESSLYTLGVYGGLTPDVDNLAKTQTYSNHFVGADFTISVNPIGGNNSRLVGPGNRGITTSGDGITRVDLGIGAKRSWHKTEQTSGPELKTGQTEYQVFAGAKILMINLSAGYTSYKYGDEASAVYGNLSGVNYTIMGVPPESAVNIKLDIPFFPIVTPYVGYAKVKYSNSNTNTNNYELGAYLDFAMLSANVSYQIAENGGKNDGFLSAGVGLKFE